MRVVGDVLTLGWTLAWAGLGWLIFKTVLGLQVITDGITSTGTTLNGWIASFRSAVPGGIPLVTQFLLNVAVARVLAHATCWPVTGYLHSPQECEVALKKAANRGHGISSSLGHSGWALLECCVAS